MTDLPYEIQFQYLLDLPYQDVLNYCQTSTAAYAVCQSESFWQKKSLRDFGIPLLNIVSGGSPQQQYLSYVQLSQNAPFELTVPLLTLGRFRLLADLIEKVIDRVGIYPYFWQLIARAGPEAAREFLRIAFAKGQLNEFYLAAVMEGRLDVIDVISQYYDVELSIIDIYDIALNSYPLPVIRYILSNYPEVETPDLDIYTVITRGDKGIIDYFRRLYPGFFNNAQYINAVMRQMIEEDEDLNALRSLIALADEIIDYDAALRLARELERDDIVEYLENIMY